MNPILENACRLLKIMVEAPKNEWVTKRSLGLPGTRNQRLQDLSGLTPEEINDAVAWLDAQGAIAVIAKDLGDKPFDFRWVQKITAQGKYFYHENCKKKDAIRSSLVISLHGMRTHGKWQKELTSTLGLGGFIHEPLDYGFYRAIMLVIPFMRRRQVRWFLEEYTHIGEKHRIDKPSIIAHSFGTYLVANAMSMYPEVKFDRMILAGSIVPVSYPWRSRFAAGQVDRVLNECAQRDNVVKIAEVVVNDAGPSGAKGFIDTADGLVIERKHSRLGHSGYFYDLNYKNNWIPFLQGNAPLEHLVEEPNPSNWKFRVFRWSLIVLLTAAVILFGWRFSRRWRGTPPPQPRAEMEDNREAELRDKIVILVTNLDGPDPKNYRVSEKLLSQLRESLAGYEDTIIISSDEAVTEQEGSKRARALGEPYHANLVLWGWYGLTKSDALLTLHVENLTGAKTLPLSTSETYSVQTSIAELDHFKLQQRLSKELTALILFISGVVRFEAQDYPDAQRRLSSALDSREWPEDLVTKANAFFYRGAAYSLSNEYEKAIVDFSKTIELNPKSEQAYSNRGAAYALLDQPQNAIRDFSIAVKINNRFVEAYDNRGMAYNSIGKFQESIADHSEAIRINPRFADAYLNRGRSYAAMGDAEKALNDYSAAIQINPQYASALHARGILYTKQDELTKAIADFSQVIEINPKHAIAYLNRGNLYARLEETQKALADYTQAIQNNPQLTKAYVNRASTYELMGESDKAIDDLSRAIEIDPQDMGVLTQRGLEYQLKGMSEKAIEDLSKVIKIGSKDYRVWYARAVAFKSIGLTQEAISDCTQALRLSPREALVYHTRGSLNLERGEPSLAISDLSHAIKINPQDAETYYDRGVAYRALRQNEMAIQDFSQAIALNPRDAAAYNNRANAFKDFGELQKAISDYSQAIQIDQTNALIYYNRGLGYMMLGEKQRAVADFSQAVRINPAFAHAYNDRGAAFAELGEYANAFADYAKALEIDPQMAAVYYNRGSDFATLGRIPEAIADFRAVVKFSNDPISIGHALGRLRQLGAVP